MTAKLQTAGYQLLRTIKDGPLTLTEQRAKTRNIHSDTMLEARDMLEDRGLVETYIGLTDGGRGAIMIIITESGKAEMKRLHKRFYSKDALK